MLFLCPSGGDGYRSANCAIIAAVNDYFDRQERLAADPYLETREKEDTFLQRVMEAVEEGLRAASAGMLQFAQPVPLPTAAAADDENLSAALDFADSF